MKTGFSRILICCAAVLLGAGPVSAHQDTIIRLEKGRLKGLPENYEPAELDLRTCFAKLEELPFSVMVAA